LDLGSLSAYGRSTTSTAWATNPVRQALWWLVAPYFRRAGIEISTATEQRLQEVAVQGETRLQTLEASLRATLLSELRATLSSELGGLRKDTSAIALRLGGLEEEASVAEQMHARLAEWLGKVQAQVQEHGAGLISAEQTHAQLAEWLSKLQAQVQEHGAGLAALRANLQQLVERTDSAARGVPIRPGQRIAIGDSGLVIVETVGGTRMLVRQQDHIGRIIADGREWEPHVREAIERAAQPDGIAIDAGAYIGIHTLTMARWFGMVHAFEPQCGIYHALCGNLALNGCTNVIAHNAALYDHAGLVRLASQERQETATPLKDGQPDYPHIANAAALAFDFVADGVGDVQAVPLDDIALENVRLIKVDTQGADLRVLQGAADTIRRCRPIVLFEWERDLGQQHGTTLDDFFRFFVELNYEVTMLHDTTPGRQADYIAKPR
jgi:FkbM family methyltransferase